MRRLFKIFLPVILLGVIFTLIIEKLVITGFIFLGFQFSRRGIFMFMTEMRKRKF